MEAKGLQASAWSSQEQLELKTLMQQAETLVTTINAPIMVKEEPLVQELMAHQKKCQELLKKIEEKWGENSSQ
ncbi:hypothetical protein ACFOPX_05895 [Helicobacter baculiformis]|uniref:Uncharacterized protein n=1 Tax=Helicobacter baculiformis TaxID=427351 RepID=A0ABV7ZKX2_9HELI|nr:hypothetical protein [Helicobacter baculiformis]